MNIKEELHKLKNDSYMSFAKSLIPGIQETVLGIRNPDLKTLAKTLVKNKEYEDFLKELPHEYHEENLLHGYILSYLKVSQDELFDLADIFLPYVTNWAVCDTMVRGSKAFTKNLDKLFFKVKEWINTDSVYHIRFGVINLMSYFLKDKYINEVIDLALSIKKDDYYINMSLSWLNATALIDYYDEFKSLLVNKSFNTFVHNKSIQKAIESFRIKDNLKEELKTLKIKKKG